MGLSLELFLGASNDVETTQYKFLSELQTVREAFSGNIVYPYLGALVKLYDSLNALLSDIGDARTSMPGDVSGIDLESLSLSYSKTHLQDDHMSNLENLIHWALPFIQDAIEEGKTIYEFVDQHLLIEEVGIIPAYVKEGYALVPDRKTSTLHVLRYQMSIFTGRDESFRSLKTTHVKVIDSGLLERDPAAIKLELVNELRELPNPATFSFVTDLDFPYESTLLPIAKRKLMRYLYSEHGAA